MSASDDFADHLVTNAYLILRFEENVRQEILGLLVTLEDDLMSKIRLINPAEGGKAAVVRARAERLLVEVRSLIRSSYSKMDSVLSKALTELANIQALAFSVIGDKVFKATIVTGTLTANELKKLASDIMIDGSPAAEWWARQAEGLRMAFAREVRLGYAAGESNDEIIGRIRGSKLPSTIVVEVDGKKRLVHEYSSGVMTVPRNQASALVRTAVQTLSNQVLLDLYNENEELFYGVQALVTLDGRTSTLCISRSNGAWSLSTGEPLDSSPVKIHFPGAPPWHWSCRTVLIPLVKSWKDLVGIDIKEIPNGTRASMDGQVAGALSYEDWLKTKSEAFQKKVLGPSRYELWSSGKISAAQLVSASGDPLTISELKALVTSK